MASPASAHQKERVGPSEMTLAPYQQAAVRCTNEIFPPPRADDPPAVRAAYGKWTADRRGRYERCMAALGMDEKQAMAFMDSVRYRTAQPDPKALAAQRAAIDAIPPATEGAAPRPRPVPAAAPAPAAAPSTPPAGVPPPAVVAPAAPDAVPTESAPAPARPSLYVKPSDNGGRAAPRPIYLP